MKTVYYIGNNYPAFQGQKVNVRPDPDPDYEGEFQIQDPWSGLWFGCVLPHEFSDGPKPDQRTTGID